MAWTPFSENRFAGTTAIRQKLRSQKSWSLWGRVVLVVLAGAFSLGHFGTGAAPQGRSDSASTQEHQYRVSFQPIAGAPPVTFRDAQGNIIGQVDDHAVIEMAVNESTIRRAATPNGIDVRVLIQAMSTVRTRQGAFVRVAAPFQLRTIDGRVVPAGSPVLMDLRRYSSVGVVQPAGSSATDNRGQATRDDVVDRFNDVLQEKGVRGVNGKIQPGPQEVPRVPLLDSPSNQAVYGDRVFSSPTCDCRRGSCLRTSHFGRRASFKTLNGKRASTQHQGLDIAGGAGTPIIAAADGCVSRKLTNRASGYGLTVYLDHGGGLTTQYSHLQSFSSKVQVGQCFKRGDVIAYMGQTGNATGPHLHFGVLKNGAFVDPERYLLARSNADLSRSCSAQPHVESLLAAEGAASGATGSGRSSMSRGSGLVR